MLSLILGFVFPLLWVKHESDQTGVVLLIILLIIQLLPFTYCALRHKFNFLSFIFLIRGLSSTTARLVAAYTETDFVALTSWEMLAVEQEIVCSLITIGAYQVARALAFRTFFEEARYELLSMTSRQMIFVAAYVFAVPITIQFLPAAFLVIHFAFAAADTVLLFTGTVRNNEKLAKLMRFLVFISGFWYFLQVGMLTMVGQFITYSFVTMCLRRQYKRLPSMLLIALLIILTQSVKHHYRLAIRSDVVLSPVEKVALFGDLLYRRYIENDLENIEENEDDRVAEGLTEGFSRVGDPSLPRVLEMTPQIVPYWGGETYQSIPYMFLPRFLYPDKPTRHFWNKFGRVYGFLSSDDFQTSMAVNFLAEGYMNFGYTGMYSVALLMGLLIVGMEWMSYFILRGHFLFTFCVFLLPFLTLAQDLGSILMSLTILTCVLLAARPLFLKMAKRDAYGTFY